MIDDQLLVLPAMHSIASCCMLMLFIVCTPASNDLSIFTLQR